MKHLLIAGVALALAAAQPAGAASGPGELRGGIAYTLPQWFKPSFLDFREDVREARARGRHVILFIHLDECPYCARMLEENFVSGANRDFMQKHFDVIAINIRGNLEVTWVDGSAYTERTLARHLKAIATPTLVFLGPDGRNVLQLTGYRDPRALRSALEYVQTGSYHKQPFTAYLGARDQSVAHSLRDHPQFSTATNFNGYRKPLAILFEDRRCAECARFHDMTLNHPDVLAEMRRFLFVRLDTDSSDPITDLDGNRRSPAEWARALELSNRPAVVLFNEGREIFRMDSRLYHFHFKEALRYVSGGYYKRYESISAYNAARRDELLKLGVRIDYGE